MTVGEGISVSEVFRLFKDAVTTVGFRRMENAWWTNEVKETIQWKRKAYKIMIQRNLQRR